MGTKVQKKQLILHYRMLKELKSGKHTEKGSRKHSIFCSLNDYDVKLSMQGVASLHACLPVLIHIVVNVLKHALTICQHAVVIFLAAYYDLVELTKTCTSRDEVTTDYVLLHTLKTVALAVDSCLVEHLGGLLE